MSMDTTISKCRHTYAPLNSGQIRILVLEPSDDDHEPLYVSFHVDSLENLLGHYEALSHVWGQPKLDYPLNHSDGSYIRVTENLNSALRRIRKRHRLRWVWADAVCIDQENDQENGDQVQLMGQIFRSARRVVVWLGLGGGQKEEGMAILGALSRQPMRQQPFTPVEGSNFLARILSFLGLDWFKRLWIVQECVLNTECCLIFGASKISFPRLISGLLHFLRYLPHFKHPSMQSLMTKADLWKAHCMIGAVDIQTPTQSAGFNILDLVETFSGHYCSNDHDRIFALYGLATNIAPLKQRNIKVRIDGMVFMDIDYTTSADTYTSFAYACIEAGMIAQLVKAVSRRSYRESPTWPSWVPNWRTPPLRDWSCPGHRYADMSLQHVECISTRLGWRKDAIVLSPAHYADNPYLYMVHIDDFFKVNDTGPDHLADLARFCGSATHSLGDFLTHYFTLPESTSKDLNAHLLEVRAEINSSNCFRSTNIRNHEALRTLNRAISEETKCCRFFRSSCDSNGHMTCGWTSLGARIDDNMLMASLTYSYLKQGYGFVFRPPSIGDTEMGNKPILFQGLDRVLRGYRLVGEAMYFTRFVSMSLAKEELFFKEMILE